MHKVSKVQPEKLGKFYELDASHFHHDLFSYHNKSSQRLINDNLLEKKAIINNRWVNLVKITRIRVLSKIML